MKFKIVIFLLFLTSCTSHMSQQNIKTFYNSKGFAYIYNDQDRANKITSKKFDNEKLSIGHHNLRAGTIVQILNPENNLSLTTKITKRTKYPNFYKILVTKAVSDKLKLNPDVPYVEINEVKKNKSFIAKEAEIHSEEKNVSNKAPIASVKINNISKVKNNEISKSKKVKKFSMIVAEFYSLQTANLLKKRLTKELSNFDAKMLTIQKRGKNRFELISGPYKAINSLKNDYITLYNYGFEDLDIKIIK